MKLSWRTAVLWLPFTALPLIGGQPGLVSISPASQSTPAGTETMYTAVASDTDGAADLENINILISGYVANNFPAGNYYCWLSYSQPDSTISVYNSGKWTTATAGVSGSALVGDECTVDPSRVSASASGNNLSVMVPIVFTPQSPATFPIFMNAGTNSGVNTGYQQMGSWTVQNSGTKLFTISISPAVGYLATNQTTTAKVDIADDPQFNGTVNLAVGPLVNGAGFTATLDKTSITGSGTATLTIQTNSQTPPHNATIPISASTQDQSVTNSTSYVYAIDNGPPTPTIQGNNSFSGSQAGVAFVIDDGSKTASEIPGANMLINSSLNGQNACWLWFDAQTGYIWLANDDASSWSGMLEEGGGILENSQCAITLANSAITIFNPGQTVVMRVGASITLKSGFSGSKIIFGRAANKSGYDSGYQQVGTWTAP